VRHKKKTIDPEDPESSVIVISADFREESPFFALSEYRVYADEQLQQSRRWVEKSLADSDARDYDFPWTRVEGDLRLEGVPPRPLSFQLDRGRLLNLLVGHTIYNDPTVAIREIIQNSLDAVRFQHHLNVREAQSARTRPPAMGRVVVRWDPAIRELSVEDNGVGMDLDVIQNLRLRKETIDTSKQNIGEIVRHWVILPECDVIYAETGLPEERVGFKAPADALRHYRKITDDVASASRFVSRHVIEYKIKERVESYAGAASRGTSRYELAFATAHGGLPEKTYAPQPKS
jgi:hypothetical protein